MEEKTLHTGRTGARRPRRSRKALVWAAVVAALAMALIVVLPAPGALAAPTVTLDGTIHTGQTATGSSISFTHTTGTGDNRLLLVSISWNCGTTNRTISSVTFTPSGGSATALTEVKTQLGYNATNPRYSAIYKLVNPASGVSGTIAITFSGAVSNGAIAGAANFANVDQTTPLGTPVGAGSATQDTTATLNVTSLTGNELVFANLFMGVSATGTTFTPGSGQSSLWSLSGYTSSSTDFNTVSAASTKPASGSSVTMSWTASATARWAIAAVPIRPVVIPAPTVSSITPTSGSTLGGTAVTINGTNLSGATAFSFGSVAATDVEVVDASQVTCVSPAQGAGPVDVTVTTSGGTSATSANDQFTYVVPAPPTITSITPSSGPAAGGTSVTIAGTNLSGASVTFGGTAATGVTATATQITCTTPAGSAGAVDVVATTVGGSATSAAGYTYVAAPTITSITPDDGTTAGGTSVTIAGTNLSGASVTFGGTAATGVTATATQITCTTPAHAAGAVDVVVTTIGGSATSTGGYTYIAPPGPTRYDQTNGNIVYSGTWTPFTKAAAYDGTYGRSSSSGASAIVYFTGTRFAWIGMKGTTGGKVDVYLDDVKMTTINLNAPTATYQATLWDSGTLSDGAHYVRLVRSSSTTSGKFIVLDAVDIWGSIMPKPILYDQTNTKIVYSGNWAPFSKTSAYGGSYARANSAGASATIYFTGTDLDLFGMKGTTTGIVDIYLDGVKKDTIDLSATTATYQVDLWSTGFISNGSHYVTMKLADTSPTGRYIVLDAVGIFGTLVTAR